MNRIKTFLGWGIIASMTAVGCQNTSTTTKSTTAAIEPLTNNVSAEKQQLFLRLVEEVATDSSVIYTAKSTFANDTVGVQIEVLKNIKPGVTETGAVDQANGFVKGAIKLSSIGVASDNFVTALGTIFKLPTSGKMSTDVILPTVFSSNKGTVDLSKQATYSFKLFFDNTQGEPAEVFALVDTYRRSFELSEKDSTYRQQLLSAFEQK